MAKKPTPTKSTKSAASGTAKRAAKAVPPPSRPATLPSKAHVIREVIEASEGILRLAPTWVPRSFLTPGRRLKLHPDDIYALGAERGGIDERWFASTTPAANVGAPPDEGLSYVVSRGQKVFTLKEAIEQEGPRLIGQAIWDAYHRWPVYSKFFDNMGPIPHHMHQNNAQAALVGQQGKPEAYYFPPQLNSITNNFPYTFFGLEPGTTKQDIRRCLERWKQGDNGILDYSKAYRLKPGTGWLVPPCILHAPGSLVTYEPQWGSDVFAMYQSMVEGRYVPWDLLIKDVPPGHHHDLDYLVNQLDWEANVDPNFKDHHYLEPIPVADTLSEGYIDKWVVYGKVNGQELFTAKELTVMPGVKVRIKDNGAYGLITVQGSGWIGRQRLQTPAMIRFGELTEDEVFVTHDAAREGVVFDNTGSEPLVTLRYFGPNTNPNAPEVGDHKRR
ncbi:MAG: hypothetical protein NZM31_05665 [Gemmatales bacterium]|nr:hypothetical protein [Gemmatales bacterium]MDW8386486.1 hypothetical protein [Gemmatales bacterium]